ncbi:MAG: hypothetical protein IKP79_02765, partial [Bacilli bacterium]|nr:hypothetical protein [Bacilli bacterium]
LDRLVGVKGELLVDDKVKYTLSYIDNPVNGYCEEEVYTMIQQLQEEVSYLRNNPSGGSSGEGSSSLSSVLEAYPIGSLYISTTSTNPGTLFGGTWVSFGSGKTLVGVDTNNSKFNTVEKTGGNESVSYTPIGTVGSHTLTVAELPSHTHSIPSLSGTAASAGAHNHTITTWDSTTTVSNWNSPTCELAKTTSSLNITSTAGAHTHSVTTNASTTGSSGSGNGHDHSFSGTASNIDVLDPYITVYMWKRTA